MLGYYNNFILTECYVTMTAITVFWVMVNVRSLLELQSIFRVFKGFLGVWLFSGIKYLYTNLWELWEIGLYLYLGNPHILVAMFHLVYHPGILGLFLINKSGNYYLV